MTECGFCQGGPVMNAARWTGGAYGPAILACPRCGNVWRPTHTHTVVPVPGSLGYDDERRQIELHEVTCCFEDDPTSDDAIVVSNIWLDPDQVDGEPFPCPVCGDEVATR